MRDSVFWGCRLKMVSHIVTNLLSLHSASGLSSVFVCMILFSTYGFHLAHGLVASCFVLTRPSVTIFLKHILIR